MSFGHKNIHHTVNNILYHFILVYVISFLNCLLGKQKITILYAHLSLIFFSVGPLMDLSIEFIKSVHICRYTHKISTNIRHQVIYYIVIG